MKARSSFGLWALGACEPGQEHRQTKKWAAKGVSPILYTVPAGSQDHSALYQTLQNWADTYRDGVQGKEAIVVNHALTRPQNSTPQDDFVGRMLWALSDKSGLPAKRFADFNPVPSLDWLLESFGKGGFGYSDLARFDVPPHENVDAKLSFSLIRRPASYDRAPPMLLVSGGVIDSKWDDVMFQLARWLVRHLNDPRLIIWIAEHGGHLHERLSWLIDCELDRLASLERDGKTSELDDIRLYAPKAIPSPLMRTLWRLLLSGRVKTSWHDTDLYRWQNRLRLEGLTTTLRLELRELLAPKVVLKKPFRWSDDESSTTHEPTRIKQLVNWELELTASHVHSTLRDLADEPWRSVLPQLFDDLQQLLRDALDLSHELGGADNRSDHSYWDLPSISPHRQNRGFHDWVSLIELLRDAWQMIFSTDSARAIRIAQTWFELPYPTFKRLAFFAASHDDCILPDQWVDWLVVDESWWLWVLDTRREVCRLLVLQGRYLAGSAQGRLEEAIIAGPPREMYRDDLEDERWQGLVAHSVWLHLAKLNTSGVILGTAAASHLAELSRANPQWQLATNESDEFSHWMSGTGDPDFEDRQEVEIAPRKRQDLVLWLRHSEPQKGPFNEDTWSEVCRTRFFHSALALGDLAQEEIWPTERWRKALQVWAENGMVQRSWRFTASLVEKMPDETMQELQHALTWWLEVASQSLNCHESILLVLCRRVLKLPLDAGSGSYIIRNDEEIYDPIGTAINHPIGHVTQSLINFWFKKNPNDNDLLPADLKPIFTSLCDVQVERYRHARVLLGSQLIAFFRVDSPWTEQYLLPLLSWTNVVEAKGIWEGFLWSPRLYQPLLAAFKPYFLESANHYADLGEHRQQFVSFLTYAALGPVEGYSVEEFRSAFGGLPQEGLEETVQALFQALEGAADQREEYWMHRVQPFWQKIWPKSCELKTPRIAETLSRLVIAARGEFPAALAMVKDWLQPIEYPYYVVHILHKSGLCKQFPAEALQLLNLVVSGDVMGLDELRLCLQELVLTKPNIEHDNQYIRINELLRMRGM